MFMRVTKHKTLLLIICIFIVNSGIVFGQDWPQWLGVNRDGKVTGFKAPATWPEKLTEKWKIAVGEGTDSTPILVGDKLYVFTRKEGSEVLYCLNAETGKEIWKDSYEAPANISADRDHSGPRSTPAFSNGMIVTFGISGTLSCLDATSAQVKWRKNDFPGQLPQFNAAMSPIIVDDMVIGQFGGKQGNAAVVAYDIKTGDQKWKWDSPGTSHSSPNVTTIDGTKMVIVMTANTVVGLKTSDGTLLWTVPFAGRGRQCVTPIIDGQNVILCGGNDIGIKAVAIKKDGDKFTAEDVWTHTVESVEYNTPTLKDGFLYAFSRNNNYFCLDAKTGKLAWTQSTTSTAADTVIGNGITITPAGFGGGRGGGRGGAMGGGRGGNMGGGGGRGGGMGSAGYGSIVDAGSVLIGLNSSSKMVVLEPNNKEYKELVTYQVSTGQTFAYPVVSGNNIYIMDQTSIALLTIE